MREKNRAPFARPTLADVADYCAERQNHVDPGAWFDHYESNGWRVGKSAMKDWRASVRTWEHNGITGSAPRKGYNAKGGMTQEAILAFGKELKRKELGHEQG